MVPKSRKVEANIEAGKELDRFQTMTNENGTIIVPRVVQNILIPRMG